MIPTEAICKIVIWKHPELRSYCYVLVETGIALLQDGISYFGSDDVPESQQPISHAVPGCAVSILRHAGIITDFFGTIPDENIYHGRRKSKRELANGRKINLFQISSIGIAESFLIRNKIEFEPIQMKMAI
jgi:hypothetical protein